MGTTDNAAFGAFAPSRTQQAIMSLARGTKLRRGAFRPMMSWLLDKARPGPIDTIYQGAAFRFYHQTSGTERGALFNLVYNLEELEFLRASTPLDGVFVDIGANVGIYAMVLARHVGRAGKVLAIEPHPVAYQRLAFNHAVSGSENVVLVAAAAGAADGELIMETDLDNLGASHVIAADKSGVRVPARTLLRILQDAGIDHVDSLKIDVEGYEDRVLMSFFRDAPEALWPRAIVIEHLSRREWLEDCLDGLRQRNYVEKATTRSNTLLVR